MVLEDVTEFDYSSSPTKLSKVLLNGNNICMVSTGYRKSIPSGDFVNVAFNPWQLIPGGEGPQTGA